MKKVIRLTESDLKNIIKRTINEQMGKLKAEDVVSCSKLGVKTMGYCNKNTKEPIEKLPCSFIGVKSPGMCDGRTGDPVK